MKQLTLEQRRSRMKNLKETAAANPVCGRRMYIHDYLPGHTVYSLENRQTLAPNDGDFNLLKELSETGIDVIQLLSPVGHDPEGVRKFTGLCHYFGIRVIFTVTDWEGVPGALWRSQTQPQILAEMDACGFDGICADMSGWTYESRAAHDPETEDMLWQLYTEVKSRGGILVLRCADNTEPPCIDKVYDYLQTDSTAPVGIGLQGTGYVIPEGTNEGFAKGIPFLQLPALTNENRQQWTQYRKLYAPMTEENTLAYLDLKECADILSPLAENVHASMYINDVKYLAVSNLSDKSFTVELRDKWTDRVSGETACVYNIKPAAILLLKHTNMEETV